MVINNIGTITEPALVTLAGVPNFLQLASASSAGSRYAADIRITGPAEITVDDTQGGTRVLRSTTDPAAVTRYTFYLSAAADQTAENVREALASDPYLAANYDIYVVVDTTTGGTSGTMIRAKEIGAQYNLDVQGSGFDLTPVSVGSSNDTIAGNTPVVTIEADLYEQPVPNRVTSVVPEIPGDMQVTMSKSYNGTPVWLDMNAVAAQIAAPRGPLLSPGIFDPGTLKVYSARLRRRTYTSTLVYMSSLLYVLPGFGALDDANDLSAHVFTGPPVLALTDRPLTHTRHGMMHYLSFMLGVPLTNKLLALQLMAYDGSGQYLGSTYPLQINANNLGALVTFAYHFDNLLTMYPGAERVAAVVNMNGAQITVPETYKVAPDCLHKLAAFTFLNRFGVWDSFNFDGQVSQGNDLLSESYMRSVTPTYSESMGVEGTALADLETRYTVEGRQVDGPTAEWLKQLMASKHIVDGLGRRVLIEDFRLDINAVSIPQMVYRYSETYTNGY